MAAGTNPIDVVMADLDRDGNNDLILINRSLNSFEGDLSILPGHGDGTLGPERHLAAGDAPISVTVGDVDADEIPDLLVTTALGGCCSGPVLFFRGLGGGIFADPISIGTFTSLSRLALADLKGDGIKDIAVAAGNSVDIASGSWVLLGLGQGAFKSQVFYPVSVESGTTTLDVAVGDFDGDGHQDLVTASSQSESHQGFVALFPGRGDGTFDPPRAFSAGLTPSQLAIADYDGDGRPDVGVLNSGTSDLSVLLNQGGSFADEKRIGAGLAAVSLHTADFNADGNPDLIETNFFSGDAWILLNQLPLRDTDGDGVTDSQDNCPLIANPRQEDSDLDGIGDVCDVCPTIFNPDQNPDTCRQEVVDIAIAFSSPAGKGSGMVTWRTTHEVNLTGFNVAIYGAKGERLQLNTAIIPCTSCSTGAGERYGFLVPKHKSGRNVYIEAVCAANCGGPFGPAVRR